MQTIEYQTYPMVLPNPSSNFSGSHKSPVQTTSFTSGKIRRRRIGRTVVKQSTIEWLFTPDEYDIFVRWWEEDLQVGTVPFQMDMVSGGDGQKGLHVVQFTDDPDFSHEECNWRVSVGCIIYPYPKVDDGSMLKTIFGDPEEFSSLLGSSVDGYYTRNWT